MKSNLFKKREFQKLRNGSFLPFEQFVFWKNIANRACYHYFCLIITFNYLPNED